MTEAKRIRTLPSDMSRCYGMPDESLCRACLRRLQIERDDSDRWFPYISMKPENGKCQFRILSDE